MDKFEADRQYEQAYRDALTRIGLTEEDFPKPLEVSGRSILDLHNREITNVSSLDVSGDIVIGRFAS